MGVSRRVLVPLVVLHVSLALAADVSEAPSKVVDSAGNAPSGAKLLLRRLRSDDVDCSEGGPGVPEDAIRFANTSIVIKANASTIWSFLTGMEDWADWNDVFKVRISGAPELGKRFWISSYLRTAPFALRRSTVLFNLTELEQDKRICLDPKGIPGISGRHCYVLCKVDEGTLVYNYEDHSGPLKDIVRRTIGQATTDGFARFNEFLRNQSEAVA